MKYFELDNKLQKVCFTEEGKKIVIDMIEDMANLCIEIHDKFVDEHQFFSVLKFEIDEVLREQGFLFEWFDKLIAAIADHDSMGLIAAIDKMKEISDNFLLETFQVFGVLRKMQLSIKD